MARFGITGTTRASFALYNSEDDVAALVERWRRGEVDGAAAAGELLRLLGG